MLGLDNPIHIAFVLVLLLLVFGAKRLPELGKSLGAGLRGFKESISGEDQISQIGSEHVTQRADALTSPHVASDQGPETTDRTPSVPVA